MVVEEWKVVPLLRCIVLGGFRSEVGSREGWRNKKVADGLRDWRGEDMGCDSVGKHGAVGTGL